MSTNNNAELVGRLTGEPRVGFTKTSHIPYCLFSIAVNEGYKNRQTGNWENKPPMFFQISTYNELAYYTGQILKKGMEVRVTGKIQENEYKGKVQLAIQADTVAIPIRTIGKLLNIEPYQAAQYGNGQENYQNRQGNYQNRQNQGNNYQNQGQQMPNSPVENGFDHFGGNDSGYQNNGYQQNQGNNNQPQQTAPQQTTQQQNQNVNGLGVPNNFNYNPNDPGNMNPDDEIPF